jgi:hypothetical protein
MLRKYDDKTEIEVINARLSGISFRQIYLSYGLHPSSVYHILKRHGIVHRWTGRGRSKNTGRNKHDGPGGVGGSNWVKVLENEDERPCGCCGRLFKPYIYDYRTNRNTCFQCFTGNSDEGERSCAV